VAATGATFLAAFVPAVAVASGEKMTGQNVVDALDLRYRRRRGEGQSSEQDGEGSGEMHGACGLDDDGL
jgi:hypothetical protein